MGWTAPRPYGIAMSQTGFGVRQSEISQSQEEKELVEVPKLLFVRVLLADDWKGLRLRPVDATH